MQWRFLAALVVLAAGCKAVPTAADFDFPDADGAVAADDVASDAVTGDVSDVQTGADAADVADEVDAADGEDAGDAQDAQDAVDVIDVADVPDVADSADVPDVADVPEVEVEVDVVDVADTPDVPEVPDVVDVIDVPDVADTPDVPDVPDVAGVTDVPDVVDAPDVPPVEDIVDVMDTVDAVTDAIADVLPDEVDAQPDAVPDVPVDPCAGKNCDDGNACTADTCAGGVCQWNQLPDWTACGEGMVCDGKGMCSDVKIAKGMAYIPAGTFWMGCNATKDSKCTADEKPQHKVTLSAYYMDLTETTVAQYKACADAGGCSVPSSVQPTEFATYPGLTDHPVNFVSWPQAQAYCNWRGVAFDLPTEAQWEMAARGSCEKNGSTAAAAGCAAVMRTYPWGEAAPDASYAVMAGAVSTAAVGSIPAGDSLYGLHDISGNVWEWNRDWQGTYSADAVTDPIGPASASYRVTRGGSFTDGAFSQRPSYRPAAAPSDALLAVGFRCMRTYTAPDLCAKVACPSIACATNTCDATTGKCVATPLADGKACDDGNACTTGDACTAGVCKGAAPVCGNGTCDCGESSATCTSDCGSAVAVVPKVGELLITELMAIPNTFSDEWVEVYNASDHWLALGGLYFGDNQFYLQLPAGLQVGPGAYATFAALAQIGGATSSIVPIWTYDWNTSSPMFSNTSDAACVSTGPLCAAADRIARVSYMSASTGKSWTLALSKYATAFATGEAKISSTNWCLGSAVIPGGDGDMGTPNAADANCP